MQLSKTDFMLFLRHPAWLWLRKHDKSKLPVIDDALQAIFDDGHLFEEYAEKLFPNAVRLGNESFEEYRTLPDRTRDALKNETNVILQGRIVSGFTTCIFDVLERVGNNEFNLYEIKSSSEVKDDHILDLAFQTIVLENEGLIVRKMFVIHVNKDYVRRGELDIHQMTTQMDVTEAVREHIEETREQIDDALEIIDSPAPPDYSPRHASVGVLREWMEIYKILRPFIQKHSIYKLTRLNPDLIGQLEDLKVELISDIPESLDLHPKQQFQIKATKEDKQIIDKIKIKEFLAQLKYPLYFFDYETFSDVIPRFDGVSPYQQVPFQYSLHKIDGPQGNMTHEEFLYTENSIPGIHLLKKLKKDIGNTGSVLVWYEPFEKGRNTELGVMFPQYAQFMSELNERIVDLMTPFANNWFVDKDFFGSSSLKKVLPILISELSYEKLPIHEGGTASRTWKEMVFDGKYAENKEALIKQLLEYCRMDTLAMVQLLKFLQAEVAS